MVDVVERVRELTAAAVGALPRVAELDDLTGAVATALLSELAVLRRHIEAGMALLAADLERKPARELGAASLARRAGVASGAELVQKITGTTRAEAVKAVRVGAMLEAAHAIAPLSAGAGTPGGPDAGDGVPGGSDPGAAGGPVLAPPAPRSLEVLAALPGRWEAPLAVAVRNGWLSADQGDRLRAGLGEPRDPRDAPRWRQAALDLIADCWGGQQTPEDLKRAADAMRACLDREWAVGNAERLYEARSLKRVARNDGMVGYHLLVDPLTDQEIWTPLYRSLAPRLGGPRFMTADERARAAALERDGRSNEQLLADTLVAAVTVGLAAISPGTGAGASASARASRAAPAGRAGAGIGAGIGAGAGAGAGAVPTVTIAVTARELKKAIADERRRSQPAGDRTPCPSAGDGFTGATPGAGAAADRSTGGAGHSTGGRPSRAAPDPAVAWTGGARAPVTGPRLLAAICTGRLGAILFDDSGQALDVTKHERTFSPRQRHAMALRDGGCLHPGCTTPAAACEAHHINPWNEHPANRRTETRDGVLLCRFHHLSLHNQRARIERRGAEYWLHWPGKDPVKLLPKHPLAAQLSTERDAPTVDTNVNVNVDVDTDATTNRPQADG